MQYKRDKKTLEKHQVFAVVVCYNTGYVLTGYVLTISYWVNVSMSTYFEFQVLKPTSILFIKYMT